MMPETRPIGAREVFCTGLACGFLAGSIMVLAGAVLLYLLT